VASRDGASSSEGFSTTHLGHLQLISDSRTNYPGITGSINQTVAQAPLTAAANDLMMTYGGAVPMPTYTLSGFVNGDIAAVVSGAAALSTAATSASGVGAYSITIGAGTLSAANYVIANLVNGTLNVTPAPLTLTGGSLSKVYGAAVPALTYSLTGFVNGDTAAVVSGSPTLGTTATQASNVGSYPITVAVGTLSAANYNVTNLVNGSLTVTPAPLTVTADNKSKTQGQANPTLTYTLSGFLLGQDATSAGVVGAAALSTTAMTTSSAGQYPIVVGAGTLAAPNYVVANLVDGTLTVIPLGGTIVNVGSTASPSTYGQSLSFSVTVVGTSGGATPTGQVQFQIDGANFGSAVTLVNGAAASGSIATLAAVGHTITALYAGDPTYASNSGTFAQVVNKAPLTITAASPSKVYGQPNPVLTYTLSGFVNSDTAAVVSGTASLSTTATVASGVGTYPITVGVGTLAAANYQVTTLVDGTLSVTPATLTVRADDQDMGHGDPVPALTYTLSGFVNGDSAAVVSGAPNLVTATTSTSAAGRYTIAIAPNTIGATNYSFVFSPGTLTVHPKVADVRVHWGNQSMSVLGLNRDLPFVDITAIDVLFSDDVTVTSGSLALASTAAAGVAYNFSQFTYNPTSHDATWTLPTALGVDRLLLSLGNTLGAAVDQSIKLAGARSWGFAVLPGDFDGDGTVTSADLTDVRNQMPQYLAPGATPSIWADLDGNGVVDVNDYAAVKKWLGKKLP
jgi:hypothetical protein